MANEYINFFENRGLIDGDINKGCYCVWHHWTDKHEHERSELPKEERPFVKRNYAITLIRECRLNGFVAYHDGKIVGFCNADNKENYFRLSKSSNPDSWIGINDDDKVLSIVCYVVDVSMRGKGVATALLDGVCKYAVENGFNYIEAYPAQGLFNANHCGGPFSMYEKLNFIILDNQETERIARKKLF